ncbi:MAG: OmpA family protein, partial [Bacteroidota bacterium]
ENYAGIRVYADREAKPRTYLQSRFTKSLKEGKTYCVKFHVSLADIAKYGTNNMGAYISKKQITQKEILEYDITPHVVHSRRIVYDDQYDWVEICGTYKAAGGEKFITIGNFAKQTDIETKRMKRPRGITGVQTRDSYYYIDDVSVLNMAELESCDCEKTDDGQQFAVQYTKNISEDNTLDDSRLIELKQVHFGSLKTAVEESEYAALEEVVKLLTSNEAIKLQVVGHTDNIEQLKAKNNVSKQRAEAVVAYLVSKGIAADRLTAVGNDDKDSLTDDQTASGLAQNRRVQF